MKSLLQTWEADIPRLGKVTLTELSYGPQMAVHKALEAGDDTEGLIVIKGALRLEESLDEIAANYPMEVIEAVSRSVMARMPGADEALKNLESTQTENSVSP